MRQYFSTFTSGFSEFIEKELEKSVGDVKIKLVFDGLIAYETSATPEKIQNLRFFHNSFILIRQFKDLYDDPFKPMVMWALRHDFGPQARKYSKKEVVKTFRIVTCRENQMVPWRSNLRKDLEKRIETKFALDVNPTKPDAEFWFLIRSEGYGFFGLRITNESTAEHRKKGQIRPEIANIMCRLSEPNKDDAFLDPFAGHGTIVQERLRFPYRKIIRIDKDGRLTENLKHSLDGAKNVEIRKEDSLHSSLSRDSVDKVVTDPPWGIFDKELNTGKFYQNMFTEFERIVKPGGKIVILTAQKKTLENIVKARSSFELLEKYNILVSGKKAAIYALER